MWGILIRNAGLYDQNSTGIIVELATFGLPAIFQPGLWSFDIKRTSVACSCTRLGAQSGFPILDDSRLSCRQAALTPR